MRIIAGKFRSRQLQSLKGAAIRPTSDRLRETLFNVLAELVVDTRFLDCFAGTGAVGIEALSRGAREVVFVEKQNAAATVIQKNLESLGINSGVRVLKLDAMYALRRLNEQAMVPGERFAVCFLDPPYAERTEYDEVLTFLGESALAERNGVVIAEHQRKLDLAASFGTLECVRVLRQGDAALTFYRVR